MRPLDIQVIGNELALRWEDGSEQFVGLETLRRFCPCAACMGEKDIFGTTYRPPERPYQTSSFALAGLHPVGGYAVQPAWQDGHNTGIYTWDWLRRLGEASVDGNDHGHGGCGGHGHAHDHPHACGHGHGHEGHAGHCKGH